jgi:hypothetical protein
MRDFLAGLKRWYLRRFCGVVAPPAYFSSDGRKYGRYAGQGTTWQQHGKDEWVFACACQEMLAFTAENYVIREQEHVGGCEGIVDRSSGNPAKSTSKVVDLRPCSCPVIDARYVKICAHCRRGHWKEAIP